VGLELSELQVKIIQGSVDKPSLWAEHLRDKDAAFLHTDCTFPFLLVVCFVQDEPADVQAVKEFHTPGEHVDKAINAETIHSKAIIDACVASGVKHVVYSALDDFPEDKRVVHASAKAEGMSRLLLTFSWTMS